MSETFNFTRLSAGPISVVFDKGGLRYIRYREREILRGIAFFVRDANWGTVPNKVEDLIYDETTSGFRLNFKVKSISDAIDFRWDCTIQVDAAEISFEIKGKSHGNFKRNRIGFVILHPGTVAGKAVEVIHSDDSRTAGQFPAFISPHQPFKDIREMRWEPGGLDVRAEFEGEVFEMEDQRNWLDASFKTYCTPLELPFPVMVKHGDEVCQRVKVVISGSIPEDRENITSNQLMILEGLHRIPEIGLAADEAALSEEVVEHLGKLALSHLRVEVRTYEEAWKVGFNQQIQQARQLDLPIELFIYTKASDLDNYLKSIKASPGFDKLRIKKVMAFDPDEKSNSREFIGSVSGTIRENLGNVPLGVGTDYYFTEVNRFRPPMDEVDFLSFSVHPQVHAFDDRSILETPSTFLDIGKSAKQIARGKPVHISPVTLAGRLNPDATDPKARFFTKSQRTDPRQAMKLGALWTLASLKYMAQTDIDVVTLFQTYGVEGILKDEELFPVYRVLLLMEKMKEYQLLETTSSNPLVFDGLVFLQGDERYYVLMNFTDSPQSINIDGRTILLPATEIRLFDGNMNLLDSI